ncbi:hypothetical protein [Azospirillum sp.]|uniref:hypothetical protein n=1 Tax=Azospirillum sp. TaxID=34012 RepID=UPI002D57C6F7|nr:hypothetical protein [Azospirillum sp.]HYF86168.1 hypothetical protein [Azospirillum sp.]
MADTFEALVNIFTDRTTKQSRPSLDTLAERAGVGYSTAKAAIPVLMKFGWVVRQARYRRIPVRGSYTVVKTSNLYTITIPKRWHRYFDRRAKLRLGSLQRYLHGRALQLAAHWSADWVAAMEDFARRAVGLPSTQEAVQAPAERPEPPQAPVTPLPAPPHLRGPLPRLPELLVNQIDPEGNHPLIQMVDTPQAVIDQWQAGLEALRQAATKSNRLTARNHLHAILEAERTRRGLPSI